MNLYGFVGNDGMNAIDYLGFAPEVLPPDERPQDDPTHAEGLASIQAGLKLLEAACEKCCGDRTGKPCGGSIEARTRAACTKGLQNKSAMRSDKFIIAILLFSASVSADMITKGVPFSTVDKAMKVAGYGVGGSEVNYTWGDGKEWGVGGGNLVAGFKEESGDIMSISYCFSFPGRKSFIEPDIIFEVESFDTTSGKMIIATRDLQEAQKNKLGDGNKIAKGVLVDVANKAMKLASYDEGKLNVAGEEADYRVWRVGEGLLLAKYRRGENTILGVSYTFIVSGPKGFKSIVFDVISFDAESGQMVIECGK